MDRSRSRPPSESSRRLREWRCRRPRKEPMERADLKSIVESLLFVADGPLTLQRLGEVLEGSARDEIRSVLEELQAELEKEGRGVRLVEIAGGYQLRTPKVNAEWVKKLLGGRPPRMSRATLETPGLHPPRHTAR